MDGNKGNGNTVLLTVIGVATLLVALVGATFAYFTATTSNDNAQSFVVNTVTATALTYTGNTLTLDAAQPGDTDTKTFTVSSPSDAASDMAYTLTLVIDANGFVSTNNAEQLMLALSATTSGTNAVNILNSSIDLTDGTSAAAAGSTFSVVTSQTISAGETHTYTAVLTFAELNLAQDENQTKSFAAHIEISNVQATK